jgi:replicative DNA helicase
MLEERLPPHDIDSEKALVGSLLMDGELIYEIVEIVKTEDFYSDQTRSVFASCLNLYEKKSKIDHVTVAHDLAQNGKLEEIGGAAYLNNLIANVPGSLYITEYALIINDLATKRRVIAYADRVNNMAHDVAPAKDVVSKSFDLLLNLQGDNVRSGLRSIKKMSEECIKDVTLWIDGHVDHQGISTGFKNLDYILDGLEKQKLYMVVGRPSMGKTQLALNMMKFQAQKGHIVGDFSLEQSKKTMLERLALSEAQVNKYHLRDDKATREKFWQGWTEVEKLPIYINDTDRITTTAAMAEAMVLKRTLGLDIVYFDYINLAGDQADSDVKRLGDICLNLRSMAKTLNIPVVAFAQLSRVGMMEKEKRPLLSHIRDSGRVEEYCDVIIGLYRDEILNDGKEKPVVKNVLEAIVLKNRDGRIGTADIYYQASTGFMGDLTK